MIDLINALGSTLHLPLTMGWKQVNLSKQVSVQGLSRGGGVISGRVTYQPRSFALTGSLYTGTQAGNNDLYDDIKKFLTHEPIEVDRGYDRRIIGYVTNFECNGLDADIELEIRIGMIAPTPFFYGAEILTEYPAVTTSSSEVITATGSYPARPIITVYITSATASGLSIDVGDYTIVIIGDYVSGDTIVIDCTLFTVELNSVSILNSVGDDFLLDGIRLLPGDNAITMTITGTADFTFLYRPIWL